MTFAAKDKASSAVHVLEDINLDVREGEFVCIVGPSGCGKSTLFNIGAASSPPPGARSRSTASA